MVSLGEKFQYKSSVQRPAFLSGTGQAKPYSEVRMAVREALTCEDTMEVICGNSRPGFKSPMLPSFLKSFTPCFLHKQP